MPVKTEPSYSVEDAENDIATLRDQVGVMGEVSSMNDVDPPSAPSSGFSMYSAGGDQKYASADGNAYNTGRFTSIPANAVSLTSAYQTVCSSPLGLGSYRIRSQLLLNPSVSGGTPSYQFAGSGGLALSHGRIAISEIFVSTTGGPSPVQVADWNSDGTLPGSQTSNLAIGASLTDRLICYDGYIVVSTAGTLLIQAKLSSGSASVLQYGTYLDVMPVS